MTTLVSGAPTLPAPQAAPLDSASATTYPTATTSTGRHCTSGLTDLESASTTRQSQQLRNYTSRWSPQHNKLLRFLFHTWCGNFIAALTLRIAIAGLSVSTFSSILQAIAAKWTASNDALQACISLCTIGRCSEYCKERMAKGVVEPPDLIQRDEGDRLTGRQLSFATLSVGSSERTCRVLEKISDRFAWSTEHACWEVPISSAISLDISYAFWTPSYINRSFGIEVPSITGFPFRRPDLGSSPVVKDEFAKAGLVTITALAALFGLLFIKYRSPFKPGADSLSADSVEDTERAPQSTGEHDDATYDLAEPSFFYCYDDKTDVESPKESTYTAREDVLELHQVPDSHMNENSDVANLARQVRAPESAVSTLKLAFQSVHPRPKRVSNSVRA